MTRPFLSIIMPVHNGDRWLATALKSLADQDEQNFECVVIDSSQDASLAVIRQFEPYLNLCIHRRPDLVPWQAKTNFGVAEAQANHVSMLHQDDYWLPGRALAVRTWIQSEPNAVLYLHPCLIVNGTGRALGTWRCPLPTGRQIKPEILFDRLLVQNFVAIPAPVFRRDTFLAVGGMDETLWYTADWDLYLKIAAAGPVIYFDEVLACFRIHTSSLTVSGSRHADDFRRQMEIVLARHLHRVRLGQHDKVIRAARASIAINAALAAINSGRWSALADVFRAFLSLGPGSTAAYLRDSRFIERVMPRLKARWMGDF